MERPFLTKRNSWSSFYDTRRIAAWHRPETKETRAYYDAVLALDITDLDSYIQLTADFLGLKNYPEISEGTFSLVNVRKKEMGFRPRYRREVKDADFYVWRAAEPFIKYHFISQKIAAKFIGTSNVGQVLRAGGRLVKKEWYACFRTDLTDDQYNETTQFIDKTTETIPRKRREVF